MWTHFFIIFQNLFSWSRRQRMQIFQASKQWLEILALLKHSRLHMDADENSKCSCLCLAQVRNSTIHWLLELKIIKVNFKELIRHVNKPFKPDTAVMNFSTDCSFLASKSPSTMMYGIFCTIWHSNLNFDTFCLQSLTKISDFCQTEEYLLNHATF